jgi:hypothetical protein
MVRMYGKMWEKLVTCAEEKNWRHCGCDSNLDFQNFFIKEGFFGGKLLTNNNFMLL